MKAIILLGAPGSGKGTVAEGIETVTSYVHLATGDMLREALKKSTELGKKAETYMKRGELVPDDIVIRLVEEKLDSSTEDGLYMFDGFPRTLPQSELLEAGLQKRNSRLEHVFFLDAPRDVLIHRLSGRRTCRSCGANYHVVNIPPKKEGVCDTCGGEICQRPDDGESTIVRRLEVYGKQTESLIAHYERKGILRRVDSSRGKDRIAEEILGILGTS